MAGRPTGAIAWATTRRYGNRGRVSVDAWIPDEIEAEHMRPILCFVRSDQAHVHVVGGESRNDPPNGSSSYYSIGRSLGSMASLPPRVSSGANMSTR